MPLRLPVVAVVLALGVTLGVVAVGLLDGGGRGAVRTPGEDRSRPARPPSPGPGATSLPGDRSGALAVLHDWDRRRAEAWAAGDPEALRDLYLPGSSAAARDAALLRRYRARGYVVRGLRMQLLGVRVLVARARVVRLEVTDRLAGAEAVPIGADEPRRLPSDAASTRVLELRRIGGAWLMARVGTPQSGGR